MLPTVVLLLSVLIVRASACDELTRATFTNLQISIQDEERVGFRKVFPINYYIQHHFNGSALCNDSCCVISAAFLLADSWKQLLLHIESIHMKHKFISELIFQLNSVWQESFQETPKPYIFPSVSSSPRELLSYTSNILAKWLALNCQADKKCVFPTPAPLFSEREKRGIATTMKNGNVGLSARPAGLLFAICLLRMLKEME